MNKLFFIASMATLVLLISNIFFKNSNRQEELNKRQLAYFDNLNSKKINFKHSTKECENIMVINKTTISDYATWLTEDYNNYCIVPATNCNFDYTSCTASVVKYDTDLYFKNHPNDLKKEGLASWLQKNGQKDYFCFDASYQTIENAHIADLNLSGILMELDVQESITFGNVLAFINADNANTYANDKYNYYIHFYFNSSGDLKMELSPTFNADGGYFSLQLLKSIVYRRNTNRDANGNLDTSDDIVNTTNIDFRKAKLGDNDDRVVFSIKTGTGDEADFYDFSQIPPKAIKVNLYAFSPL